jgi:hypothetical protein
MTTPVIDLTQATSPSWLLMWRTAVSKSFGRAGSLCAAGLQHGSNASDKIYSKYGSVLARCHQPPVHFYLPMKINGEEK